ncbi:MAG: LysR substrate-binding domain-containing protein [Verrucomicrobiota bacterium]
MNFSLRELECFVAVAEELSFTRAAERLRLAQPPLSRHIKNLEDKLGVSLFERSRRKVALAPGGRAFLTEAKAILLQVQRAGETARRAAEGETDKLDVGFVSAVLSPELVNVFSRFREKFPGVRLNLHDRLPVEQMEALQAGTLDLGFVGVAPEKQPSKIELTAWRNEPLMAFLPLDHDLAGRERVDVSDLMEEAFVMISPEAAPSFASHVYQLCREAGYRPRVVQEARRAQAVAAMTVAGSGVAILPASLNRITGNGMGLWRGREKARMAHVVAHSAEKNQPLSWFLDLLDKAPPH